LVRHRGAGAAERVPQQCIRHGWLLIAVFLLLGLGLEGLHLVKLPAYMDF